jgi:hypothetical protein
MSLAAADLKTALLAELATLPGTEAAAIEAWAEAFATYFEGATANGVPATPAALHAAAKTAMKGAMSGLSTAGATAIQAGVVAFWGALVAAPPTYFTAALALSAAPGLSGLAPALAGVFETNQSSGASQDTALGAIATAIHALQTGGTVTFPPSVVFPLL